MYAMLCNHYSESDLYLSQFFVVGTCRQATADLLVIYVAVKICFDWLCMW